VDPVTGREGVQYGTAIAIRSRSRTPATAGVIQWHQFDRATSDLPDGALDELVPSAAAHTCVARFAPRWC